MPVSRYYSSLAQPETLTASINASATMINVSATTGFPSSLPYTLALDAGGGAEELVEVTAVAGTTLTVTRAIDGTSAQSHGVGAVVRHSSSARDFAESRAHEAATGGVHGVVGTLVGTSDAQTLSNKTMTNPSVVGGALSGTFTGTPTFSDALVYSGNPVFTGNPVYSGNPSFSGSPTFTGTPTFNTSSGVQFTRASAGQTVIKAQVSGDAQERFQIDSVGALTWGSGSATQDTNLYRSGANALKTDDALTVAGQFTTQAGTTLVGDPSPFTHGVILKAGAASNFVTEFQDASGTQVATVSNTGAATFSQLQLSADPQWTTFVPLWTSTGTAPAIGNGLLAGRYKRIGQSVFMMLLIKFGSTTTFGTGTWGFSYPPGLRPAQNTPVELTYSGSARGHSSTWYTGTASYDQGTDSFRVFSHSTATEWSPTVPVTWAASSSNYINISVTYETA